MNPGPLIVISLGVLVDSEPGRGRAGALWIEAAPKKKRAGVEQATEAPQYQPRAQTPGPVRFVARSNSEDRGHSVASHAMTAE